MKQLQIILESLLLITPILYGQEREFSTYGNIDWELEYETEQKNPPMDIHYIKKNYSQSRKTG